ncbi:GNAT family N-acetyltransferase [Opitutales bacterium ASA1]|uniref:GNAT family N-acetyltransferase n=1 Tax=Congregicoccus parvus TaxID=3081749 RepID=UPI002B31635E|nr:GNAT family N-acetyltransferase [Opitutales bacterium ASA1]
MNPPATAPCTIRPAAEADVELLLAFVRELADYEKLAHEVATDAAGLRAAMFGPRPCAEAVFAEVDGEPAGFAVFFQNFSTFRGRPGLYLEDLFVRPDYRRRGIARAILAHLAREANRRGCARFEWTVLDWNNDAQRFYREMGATILDDWRVCRLTGDALARFGS